MNIPLRSPQLLVSAFIIAAYALSVAAVMVRAGEPTGFIWWIAALPFLAWCVAPVATPLLYRSWLVIAGATAIAAWGSYEYDIQMFGPGARSTSALAFVFLPIYQWVGIAIVIAVDLLVRKLSKK